MSFPASREHRCKTVSSFRFAIFAQVGRDPPDYDDSVISLTEGAAEVNRDSRNSCAADRHQPEFLARKPRNLSGQRCLSPNRIARLLVPGNHLESGAGARVNRLHPKSLVPLGPRISGRHSAGAFSSALRNSSGTRISPPSPRRTAKRTPSDAPEGYLRASAPERRTRRPHVPLAAILPGTDWRLSSLQPSGVSPRRGFQTG